MGQKTTCGIYKFIFESFVILLGINAGLKPLKPPLQFKLIAFQLGSSIFEQIYYKSDICINKIRRDVYLGRVHDPSGDVTSPECWYD